MSGNGQFRDEKWGTIVKRGVHAQEPGGLKAERVGALKRGKGRKIGRYQCETPCQRGKVGGGAEPAQRHRPPADHEGQDLDGQAAARHVRLVLLRQDRDLRLRQGRPRRNRRPGQIRLTPVNYLKFEKS